MLDCEICYESPCTCAELEAAISDEDYPLLDTDNQERMHLEGLCRELNMVL